MSRFIGMTRSGALDMLRRSHPDSLHEDLLTLAKALPAEHLEQLWRELRRIADDASRAEIAGGER